MMRKTLLLLRGKTLSTAVFSVSFSGEAVDDGRMEVRHVASALMSTANLIDASNRVLYGNDASAIHTKIIATERGSFEIVLEAVDAAASLLPDKSAKALLGILFFNMMSNGAYDSLVLIMKKLRGRKPNKKTVNEDGSVTLSAEVDGNRIDLKVTGKAASLYESRAVLKTFRDVISPVKNEDGIDDIAFRSPEDDQITIVDKSEADDWLSVDEDKQEESYEAFRMQKTYNIMRLNFVDRKLKWQLKAGDGMIFAVILDDAFWRDVQERKTYFAAGDSLKCDVMMRQTTFEDETTKEEYFIEKVIEHIEGEQQGELPL